MTPNPTYLVLADDGSGTQYGPISESELRTWIKDGRVLRETQVWLEGSPDWKPLAELPAFRGMFAPPPQAKPKTVSEPQPKRHGFLITVGIILFAAVVFILYVNGGLRSMYEGVSGGNKPHAKSEMEQLNERIARAEAVDDQPPAVKVEKIPVKMNLSEVKNEVRQGIQRQFREDASTKNIRITDFTLAQDGDNKYKGVLTTQMNGQTGTADVEVTFDGKVGSRMEWKILPSVQTTWNTQELDAMRNGNLPFAVQTIKKNPAIKEKALKPDPALVTKAPWEYYGKPISVWGSVAVVQDHPPGSEMTSLLGGNQSSQIVVECKDGTTVEMFCMKSSGVLKVGNGVRVYGYAVGVTDVQNRLGGTDPHLILVGNDYDKL